jgi:hypothetical protein
MVLGAGLGAEQDPISPNQALQTPEMKIKALRFQSSRRRAMEPRGTVSWRRPPSEELQAG